MATRKQIINDWQQLFPELKKTGLLSLDNRLGPLITGIYIKVVRNTYYTPVAYVHNLCSEESGIITSLECTSETIALEKHEERYIFSAERLKNKLLIPLEGDVPIDKIIEGYKLFLSNPKRKSFEEYKDIENYTDTIAAFKICSEAMLMGNSSLWKKLNGDTSAVKGNIMVASLPNKNQFVRSYALAINSNSKNQEAAIRFLDFMNGKEQQRRLSRDTSLIPIIRELYDDEMILDANPHVKGIKQSVQNSSSFATVSINGENLKKLEEALIKFFNNEETSMNTGKIFEDLMQ